MHLRHPLGRCLKSRTRSPVAGHGSQRTLAEQIRLGFCLHRHPLDVPAQLGRAGSGIDARVKRHRTLRVARLEGLPVFGVERHADWPAGRIGAGQDDHVGVCILPHAGDDAGPERAGDEVAPVVFGIGFETPDEVLGGLLADGERIALKRVEKGWASVNLASAPGFRTRR